MNKYLGLLGILILGCSNGNNGGGQDAAEGFDSITEETGADQAGVDGSGIEESGIDASEGIQPEEHTPCNSPADRVKWSFRTPGPDSIISLAFVKSVDSDSVADLAVVTTNDRVKQTNNNVWMFMLSGASSGEATKIWEKGPANESGSQVPPYLVQNECLDKIADLNDDGKEDLLLGTSSANSTAFVLDSTNGNTIWMFDTNKQDFSGTIYSIHPFPDVTQDQKPEVLIGTGHFLDQALLLDGADGRVLWRYLPDPPEYFQSVAAIADINLDDYPDAILATGGSEEGGQEIFNIIAVSGNPTDRDGNLVYDGIAAPIWPSRVNSGMINQGIAPVGDLNGDGKVDVVVGVWGGTVMALSGHDGAILWSYQIPETIKVTWVVRLDDVDRDGFDDILVGSDHPTVVLSGKVGVEQRVIWSGVETDKTWAVDRVEDLNQDGINDVVSGSFDSLVRVYDGTDGTLLWSYDTGDEYVMTVLGVPDLTGDGVPDVAAGNKASGVSIDSGKVFLFEGCP